MKPDTFILNGWKQSTCGSFNSLKCSAEWKNHLCAQCYCCVLFLPLFPFSSACELSSRLRVPGGFLSAFSVLPTVLGIIFSRSKEPVPVFSIFCSYNSLHRKFSPCLRMHSSNMHLQKKVSTTLFTCVWEQPDLKLCSKESGHGRFAAKRDDVFCNIQWKLLLALIFYPLLRSRKTNIAHCSFLSFIRNGPWGTHTCKLHSSARGSTHSFWSKAFSKSWIVLHPGPTGTPGEKSLVLCACQWLCLLPRESVTNCLP